MHTASALFRLLADPTRLRLLRLLARDRFNVSELTAILALAQSVVSAGTAAASRTRAGARLSAALRLYGCRRRRTRSTRSAVYVLNESARRRWRSRGARRLCAPAEVLRHARRLRHLRAIAPAGAGAAWPAWAPRARPPARARGRRQSARRRLTDYRGRAMGAVVPGIDRSDDRWNAPNVLRPAELTHRFEEGNDRLPLRDASSTWRCCRSRWICIDSGTRTLLSGRVVKPAARAGLELKEHDQTGASPLRNHRLASPVTTSRAADASDEDVRVTRRAQTRRPVHVLVASGRQNPSLGRRAAAADSSQPITLPARSARARLLSQGSMLP